jgi:adenine-specific DNA-methyltransferase
MEYSLISKQLTNKLSKTIKKANGIYFTPPSCVAKNIAILKQYQPEFHHILEPSCGSGEYITALQLSWPDAMITGIELNKTICDSLPPLLADNTTIHNADFIGYDMTTKYNLIIGNPPYFVMKKKDVANKYYPYFEGRPNMFILFIAKSLELLADNGILSFVLPKSFLNCLYYDKTRKYIAEKFQILDIIDCDGASYMETQQDTIILIIRKSLDTINNTTFVLNIRNYTIFASQQMLHKIKQLYIDSNSLDELGFKVNVGTVVWNQCKDILTDNNTKTRLIYSSDISDHTIISKKYKNPEKKNYIDKPGKTAPCLVINRGYGVGSYHFDYCLIDGSYKYLIENHLICITSKNDEIDLIPAYKKIISSLENPKTKAFIEIYFGNNAINTTELNHMLPIYSEP